VAATALAKGPQFASFVPAGQTWRAGSLPNLPIQRRLASPSAGSVPPKTEFAVEIVSAAETVYAAVVIAAYGLYI